MEEEGAPPKQLRHQSHVTSTKSEHFKTYPMLDFKPPDSAISLRSLRACDEIAQKPAEGGPAGRTHWRLLHTPVYNNKNDKCGEPRGGFCTVKIAGTK